MTEKYQGPVRVAFPGGKKHVYLVAPYQQARHATRCVGKTLDEFEVCKPHLAMDPAWAKPS